VSLYFRKYLRLGPLRLNLSRRGVGASVGVTGARVGIDAGGREYVAGGRGGVYFRERGNRVAGVLGWLIVGAAGAIGALLLVW